MEINKRTHGIGFGRRRNEVEESGRALRTPESVRYTASASPTPPLIHSFHSLSLSLSLSASAQHFPASIKQLSAFSPPNRFYAVGLLYMWGPLWPTFRSVHSLVLLG